MENVITALVVITLVVFSLITLTGDFIGTQDALRAAWQEHDARSGEQLRTLLVPVDAVISGGGTVIEVTFENAGAARVSGFADWDAIIQYTDLAGGYHVEWLEYLEAGEPISSQWAVQGIYLDASQGQPEAFEPGVINPGEQVVLRIRLASPLEEDSGVMTTFATANGVDASMTFAYTIPES